MPVKTQQFRDRKTVAVEVDRLTSTFCVEACTTAWLRWYGACSTCKWTAHDYSAKSARWGNKLACTQAWDSNSASWRWSRRNCAPSNVGRKWHGTQHMWGQSARPHARSIHRLLQKPDGDIALIQSQSINLIDRHRWRFSDCALTLRDALNDK